jgi:hypothetical protein
LRFATIFRALHRHKLDRVSQAFFVQPLPGRSPSYGLSDTSVSEAIDRVIVDHTHRLHEGIADRRPDKCESSDHEIAAEGV